jgi:excisionase family DNA binding protein
MQNDGRGASWGSWDGSVAVRKGRAMAPDARPEQDGPDPEPQVLPELRGYEPVLTSLEVSTLLRINHQVLLKLLRDGGFPGFKVGGSWRVLRRDVQAVMTRAWLPEGGHLPEVLDKALGRVLGDRLGEQP